MSFILFNIQDLVITNYIIDYITKRDYNQYHYII